MLKHPFFVEAYARVKKNPALATALVGAVIGLVTIVGAGGDWQAALMTLVTVLVAIFIGSQTTPNGDVTAKKGASGGSVAGDGSEIPTGLPVTVEELPLPELEPLEPFEGVGGDDEQTK